MLPPSPQGWKPDDLKVYVTWEFTLSDKTTKGQTKWYKGGINPEIAELFRVDIGDRTARSFARGIKRGALKATLWYDRGFLKKPGIDHNLVSIPILSHSAPPF